MTAYGKAQHGKTETRKELAFLAIAHRGAYVHQSSQASASHLVAGVLKGLHKRRPAVFNIYTPCPVEHGLADDWSQQAARLALESRAFPFLTYDPDAGASFSDCLSLEGNPSPETAWPTYTFKYLGDDGSEQTLDVPLTIADWAATESRFKQHFADVPAASWTDEMIPFHEFLLLKADEREGRRPYILAAGKDRGLRRLSVSSEMVQLAEERQHFWSQLKQLAGLEVSPDVRDAVANSLEAGFEQRLAALRSEYEVKLNDLKASYPPQIARRLAEGLLRHGGAHAFTELLSSLPDVAPSGNGDGHGAVHASPSAPAAPVGSVAAAASAPVAAAQPAAAPAVAAEPVAAPAAADGDEALVLEAYIDSARCTTCNECTNLNKKMFAYNADKQAYVKDARAGTYQQLVIAAERCPVSLIHPGTPLNPKEKDLEKWVKRGAKFN
jgi:pyruvate-ferredoxin/flavodoxin oxidoreductase